MKDFKNLGVVDWLAILWRRKWYFVILAILIPAGVTVYTLGLPWGLRSIYSGLRTIYRSECKILVVSPVIPEDYVRPVTRASPAERIDTIRQQVQSRSFLQRIIEDNQLFNYGSPGFAMESVISALRGNIAVDVGVGNVFTLSYVGSDPQFVRDTTKRLADRLIAVNTADRKNRAETTDRFIDDQVHIIELKLKEQQDKIEQFKTAHLGELPEQGYANINSMSTLNTQLAGVDNAIEQLVDQRKQLDFRRSRLDTLVKPATRGASAAADKNAPPPNPALMSLGAQLASLKLRGLTDDHPDVRRVKNQIWQVEQQLALNKATESKPVEGNALTPLGEAAKQDQISNAADGALVDLEADAVKLDIQKNDNDLAKRRKERDGILQQIKAVEARLKLAPALEQLLAALTLDLDSLRGQYSNLTEKKFTAQLSTNLETDTSTETYKIIDEANLPESPVFPNRMQLILMGIGAGIFFGLGAVFAREFFDPTIGDEQEAALVLNLPVLASIPLVQVAGIPVRKRIPEKAG